LGAENVPPIVIAVAVTDASFTSLLIGCLGVWPVIAINSALKYHPDIHYKSI